MRRVRPVLGQAPLPYVGLLLLCVSWSCSKNTANSAPRQSQRAEPVEERTKQFASVPEATNESKTERAASACDELRFFTIYGLEGAVLRQDAAHLTLKLPVDLHGLDCGASDGYGHEMTLQLRLEADGTRCFIESAEAKAKDWNRYSDGSELKAWSDGFRPDEKYDLNDPKLKQINLRDPDSGHALSLQSESYFYYPAAPRHLELSHQLSIASAGNGDEDDPALAYGFTLAANVHWKYNHWNYPEPSIVDSDSTEDPAELAPFNQWIKKYRLGHDLRAIAERGLSLKEGAPLDIRTQDGEPPQTAILEVRDLLYEASKTEPEIERFRELKFSRNPCSTCNGGMGPWHLSAYREAPVLKTPESKE